MSRSTVVLIFIFAFALQSAQAQTFSRGIPASVTSPTPDGQTHGVPASVVSPTPRPFGVNPPLRPPFVHARGPFRRFGSSHKPRPIFIPVPLFYSYYTDPGYPSVADPTVPDAPIVDTAQAQAQPQQQQQASDSSDDELRAAYLQGAHDALAQKDDSRYGQHYLDSRERDRQQMADASTSKPKEAVPPQEDKSPATVFVFKDGHQLETKNYAIMGETLFDFSGKTLKKIQMGDIDTAATVKANDDRGVIVKLQ
ncbi:MAG TPA: hypothetical protein VJW55_15965 [Candidatus Angelobacter sp.]|nr:hypothetical protein [Candidatus Angelobacter sp.]